MTYTLENHEQVHKRYLVIDVCRLIGMKLVMFSRKRLFRINTVLLQRVGNKVVQIKIRTTQFNCPEYYAIELFNNTTLSNH